MSTRTINYGTRTAFGTLTNLNSLASAAAKVLAQVDNTSTKAIDYAFWLEIALNSAGVSATGTIEVYLLEAQVSGSGDTTDGIDMATPVTTDQAANIKNAKLLEVLQANANSQLVRFNGRLLDYIANVPPFFTLLIKNVSGAALAASGHDAEYVPIKEDIA
jgi:hypothetical protein